MSTSRLRLAGFALAVIVVLALGVTVAVRTGGSTPAPATPAKEKVLPGTEAANRAPVQGDPTPHELGLPPLDTAAEAEGDPCTLLELARNKRRINQSMLDAAPTTDTVGRRRLEAMVARQEKAIRRHEARAGKRGLDCPGG